MCNDYRLSVDLDTIANDFSDLKIKIDFPEGAPNVEAREDIRITDTAPIVRAGLNPGSLALVQRRWSWPGPTGKPVYNFRAESRDFGTNRCLIVADGFYEFTDPEQEPGASRKKLKDKWLFTLKNHRLFCIAGIYRDSPKGEAFTMLTTAPGPDIARYHDRQIIILPPDRWRDWLDPAVPTADILQPLPAGSFDVRQVR